MSTQSSIRQRDANYYFVLVLQGGGLGAIAFAYQAMSDAGYQPDWVAGISIGASTRPSSPAIRRKNGWGSLRSSGTRSPGPTAGDQC